MSSTRRVKPYDERSDEERLKSSWDKASKLYKRSDWSSAIVRLATATEISANIYVRRYLIGGYKLPSSFVDSLLISANGIDGKFNRLITPAAKEKKEWTEVKKVKGKIELVNKLRNQIVHAGRFMNEGEANESFLNALEIIKVLSPEEAKTLHVPSNS